MMKIVKLDELIAMRLICLIFFILSYFSTTAQSKLSRWKLTDSTYSCLDGSSIRFVSNASKISIRFKLKPTNNKESNQFTEQNGLDLYAIDSDGLWHWAHAQKNASDTIQYLYEQLRANDNFHQLGREYQLFLPLLAAIEFFEISTPEGSLFRVLPKRKELPVVVFGSAIAQGASASRPGLAWTNILSRALDRTVLTKSFAATDLFNIASNQWMVAVEARVFVLDYLNDLMAISSDSVALVKHLVTIVKSIRKEHPETPILLTEHAGYSDGYLLPVRQLLFEKANAILHEAIRQLNTDGIKGLELITHQELKIGLDGMSDGEHPNDLGMMRYATAYENKIRAMFAEPVGELKTQIPIRQRRTPANYDWEARHYAVLALNKSESSKILLIGNSITHNWGGKPNNKSSISWQKYMEPHKVRNFGFGADRIENVLWRIYHDELKGIEPEKIIINIGTNNLRVNSNEEIVEGLRFLAKVIQQHQPKASVTFLGIYPRRAYEQRIVAINKAFRKICKEEQLDFVDFGKIFSKSDGTINETYFSDGLHPNAAGYEILGEQIEKIINR